jgi:molybdopterin-guanine dinucleotide biosynthesis protein A
MGTVGDEYVSIALLAGGQSSRMGEDKALLRPYAGELTLIERVARSVDGLSDDLMVVAPPERGYGDLLPGWRIVDDLIPGAGPAGGVLSALVAARHDRVLVLPCDAPFVSRALCRILLERGPMDRPLVPWRIGITRQGSGRTLEVLHGVYPRAIALALERAIADGEDRQFFRIVQRLNPVLIGPEDLARFDPGLLSFRSLNSPDDVARIAPELFAKAT